jgi:hypothetical protein
MKAREYELEPTVMADIWNMWRDTPFFLMGRDAFIASTLRSPFTFSVPRIGVTSSDELAAVIELHWMPWLKDVYDWVKMFGICPYKMEPLRKTSHLVPVVPKYGTGRIVTFVDKRGQQQFSWYWLNTAEQKPDPHMLWITWDHPPSITGEIRSPIVTLLDDWRTLKIMRNALERANTVGPNPQHILEYHPSKNNTGDDDLITFEAYGEKSAGLVLDAQERLFARKTHIRTSDLMNTFNQYRNKRMSDRPSLPLLMSETDRERWDRENPDFFTNTVPLKPDFRYVAAARPQIFGDYERAQQGFALRAAAVMDFPLESIMPVGSVRGKNETGNTQYMHSKIRAALGFFKTIIRNAIVLAYQKDIQGKLDEAVDMKRQLYSRRGLDPQNVIQLYAHLEIEVELNTAPIVSIKDLDMLQNSGYMTKETAGRYIFDLAGLPPEDLFITETAPPPPEKKQRV